MSAAPSPSLGLATIKRQKVLAAVLFVSIHPAPRQGGAPSWFSAHNATSLLDPSPMFQPVFPNTSHPRTRSTVSMFALLCASSAPFVQPLTRFLSKPLFLEEAVWWTISRGPTFKNNNFQSQRSDSFKTFNDAKG